MEECIFFDTLTTTWIAGDTLWSFCLSSSITWWANIISLDDYLLCYSSFLHHLSECSCYFNSKIFTIKYGLDSILSFCTCLVSILGWEWSWKVECPILPSSKILLIHMGKVLFIPLLPSLFLSSLPLSHNLWVFFLLCILVPVIWHPLVLRYILIVFSSIGRVDESLVCQGQVIKVNLHYRVVYHSVSEPFFT